MRGEGLAESEAAVKNSNNLGKLRKSASAYKEQVKETLKFPTELLTDILKRLKLKNKYFQVFESCDENEMDAFWEIINQVDQSLSREDTTKKAVKDKKDLRQIQWLMLPNLITMYLLIKHSV